MKYYKIAAKLLSPIMIQENRQSNNPKSLSYIPGSTLRGALAMHYLRSIGSSNDEVFNALFVSGSIKYPNLYPSNEQELIVSKILPLTAVSCKNVDGFQRDADEDKIGHGVNDSLVDKLTKRLDQNASVPTCKKCNQSLY